MMGSVTVIVIFGLVLVYASWFFVRAELEQQIRNDIAAAVDEIRPYKDIKFNAIPTTLIDHIRRHHRSPASRWVYLWADRQTGACVPSSSASGMDRCPSSTLDAWPDDDAIIARDPPWLWFEQEKGTEVLAMDVPLREGPFRLLIGQERQIEEGLARMLLGRLMTAISLVAICGVAAGLLFARRQLRRLQRINQTCARIGTSGTDERIPILDNERDEIAQVTRNINAMLKRIDDLVKSSRHLADHAAHELRQPFSRILAAMDKLEAGQGCVEEAERGGPLATIRREVERSLNTLSGLRQISTITSLDKSTFSPVDLDEVLRELVEDFRALAQNKAGSINLNSESAIVHAHADLLPRAIANLIDNAIKHTAPRTAVSVQLRTQAGTLRLVVADNGKGIPSEQRDLAFERFIRLDKRQPGQGLGLSLVRAVADLHEIDLHLEDNRPGLKVILDFPCSAVQSASRCDLPASL